MQDGVRRGCAMTVQEFSVSPRLRLILTDVAVAAVEVRRGEDGAARVEVTGPDGYADTVRIEYDGVENRLMVSEPPTASATTVIGGVTVVGTGGAVVSGGSVVASSGSVVSGSGGVTVVSSGGRVVVNGVDVTEQVTEQVAAAADAGAPPARITVVVPGGTDTGAERCADVRLSGVGGRVRAAVAGASRLHVTQATGARLTVTGQSRAVLQRASGPASFEVSGQATVEAGGAFDDVRVALSGQARLTATGRFGQVEGEATGMARVELRGSVAGHSIRTSGMARVTVTAGDAAAAQTGDDWDF